ncbi:MAG: TonB-dependent receptor [Bacteroidales bacterium]|jgi:TonB-linked SusC/RagA family outer membrane protein|nr:TonB-dependent receptor [Bacteroidales bacterium]
MKKIISLTLALVLGFCALAQREVTGRVTNAQDGSPMVGATVKVKGTSSGTVTDVDGYYKLQLTGGSDLIEVSSVGFKTREIQLQPGQTDLNISLGSGNEMLGEIVVVGYGTMKKSDLTGAVGGISGDQLRENPTVNLDQGLQGRIAGVQVQANSGQPGAATSVRIRGVNSITGNNEPLYVIDGIPMSGQGTSTVSMEWMGGSGGQNVANPLAAIAPSDIASIVVLKDASAAAIYGSAGANGVIIVTTKRGQKGGLRISYDGSVALQVRPGKLSIMDLQQFGEYQKSLYDEGFLPNIENAFRDPSILGKGTDWQDEVTKNAWMHNHAFSASGGTEKTQYSLSLGYTNQDGIMLNTNFERYTARVSVDNEFNRWVKVGGTLSYARTDENIVNNDGIYGLVMNSSLMSPAVPVYDFDGNYAGPNTTSGSSVYNPVAMTKDIINNFIRDRLMGNVYGQLNLGKYVTFRTEFGMDMNHNKNLNFIPSYKYGQLNNTNIRIMQQEDNSLFWNWQNYITYNQSFGKHNVTIMVGSETKRSSWNGTQIVKEQLTSNDIHVVTSDGEFKSNNGWKDASSNVSFFGRANYNYDDRYLLTATMRGDASSRFGSNNKWGYFPSAAAAWRISQETFMEGSKNWLSNLKLRLGYGWNGNDDIGTYLYGSTLRSFPTWLGTGYRLANTPNPDLKWETAIQYNAGLDFGLFNQRVDLTVDVYYKTTKDLLLRPSISPVLGGTDVENDNHWYDISPSMMNVGKVENKGIDIALSTHNVAGKDFNWYSNIVVSVNRNKVLALDANNTPIYGSLQQMTFGGWFKTASVITVGQPIGVFYGYVTDGLYKDADDLQNSAKPTGIGIHRTTGAWIGDVKFKDLSGPNGVPDGVIDEYDQTIIGDPNPDFTFGFNNTFIYKGWELNIGLTGAVGGEILNYTRVKTEGLTSIWDNQNVSVLDRAQLGYLDGDNTNVSNVDNSYIMNPEATIPRFSGNDLNGNNRMSDRWIEDGSYLRIQNISLGYNFPKEWLKKAYITSLKLYFNAQNVWTFSKYSGLDPEIGSYKQNALYTNIDLGRYPTPRTFTLGVNISF